LLVGIASNVTADVWFTFVLRGIPNDELVLLSVTGDTTVLVVTADDK